MGLAWQVKCTSVDATGLFVASSECPKISGSREEGCLGVEEERWALFLRKGDRMRDAQEKHPKHMGLLITYEHLGLLTYNHVLVMLTLNPSRYKDNGF